MTIGFIYLMEKLPMDGEGLPPGWVAKNGELSFDTALGLEQDYKGGKDIVYGLEEFENFEFHVEWKINRFICSMDERVVRKKEF